MEKLSSPTQPEECCGNCRYHQASDVNPSNLQRDHICVRWPPYGQLLPGAKGPTPVSYWPPVMISQWCGEWRIAVELVQ